MKGGKRKLKQVWLVALAVLGWLLLLPLWAALRRRRRPEFLVLTYHSVSDVRRHETNVTPDAFERQMAWLAREATVRDLYALLTEPAHATTAGTRPVVAVTFDDGYADNALVALPILRRYALPATCFVVAGVAGSQECLPHDRGEAAGAARLLAWPEARALVAGGIAIGSHTLHHGRVGQLADDALRVEFQESRRILEAQVGCEVRLLSYPFGRALDFDARAEREARAAGYAGAASARYGCNRSGDNPYALRRIGVESSDTLFTLRAKLGGALDLLVLMESAACRRAIRLLNRLLSGEVHA